MRETYTQEVGLVRGTVILVVGIALVMTAFWSLTARHKANAAGFGTPPSSMAGWAGARTMPPGPPPMPPQTYHPGRVPGGPGWHVQSQEVLSGYVQMQLGLTDAQRGQMAALRRDIEARLARILSHHQQAQLKQIRQGVENRGTWVPDRPVGGRPDDPAPQARPIKGFAGTT